MKRMKEWADDHQGLVPALLLANLLLTGLVILVLAAIFLAPGSVLGDSLRGEPGPVGLTGPQGERGPAGPPGRPDLEIDQALSLDIEAVNAQLGQVAAVAEEADAKAAAACQTAMDVGYQTGTQPFIC